MLLVLYAPPCRLPFFFFLSRTTKRASGTSPLVLVIHIWDWLVSPPFFFGLMVSIPLLASSYVHINHSIRIVSVLSLLSHPTRNIFAACCHHGYIYDCCDTVSSTLSQSYLLFRVKL